MPKNNNNQNANTGKGRAMKKVHAKSASEEVVRVRTSVVGRPSESAINALLTVPSAPLNLQMLPLAVVPIKHAVTVECASSGRFALHPILGRGAFVFEGSQTTTAFDTAAGDSMSTMGFVDPNSSMNPIGKAVTGVPLRLGVAPVFPIGNTRQWWNGPLDINGAVVSLDCTVTGGVDVCGFYPMSITNTNGNRGLFDLNFTFGRELETGESMELVMHRAYGGSTNTITVGAQITSGNSWTQTGTSLNSVISTTLDGLRIGFNPVLNSPLTVTSFSMIIYGDATHNAVGTVESGVTAIGLDDADEVSIRGKVSTGRVAAIQWGVWLEFVGTMQQAGGISTVAKSAEVTGAGLLDMKSITALQKHTETAFNGKIPKGCVMLSRPLSPYDWGKLQPLHSLANFDSGYGAYDAVTTAAGGDQPKFKVHLCMVIGYNTDSTSEAPPQVPYDPFGNQAALALWSSMKLHYENDSHVEQIKKWLGKAGKAAHKVIDVVGKVASVAGLLAAAL